MIGFVPVERARKEPHPTDFSRILRGTPVTHTYRCRGIPDTEYTISLNARAHFDTWCAVSNTNDSLHTGMHFRYSIGDRDFLGTSGEGKDAPVFDISQQRSAMSDNNGLLKIDLVVDNFVSPRSWGGQTCSITLDGKLLIAPRDDKL